MTTEELYEKISITINNLDKKMENNINKLDKKIDKNIKRLESQVKDLKNDTSKQIKDLRNDMNLNFKKLNDKLDGVTNSNLAQILVNQTNFKNEINKKTTYNELEHKKLDCRITELELQGRYFG